MFMCLFAFLETPMVLSREQIIFLEENISCCTKCNLISVGFANLACYTVLTMTLHRTNPGFCFQ